MQVILSAYHFDGDPDALMHGHRRQLDLLPPSGLPPIHAAAVASNEADQPARHRR
jgi:hypothetical protein